MELYTTLMPNNPGQLQAVNSWQRAGFAPVSINSLNEIAKLKNEYLDVRFVPASPPMPPTLDKLLAAVPMDQPVGIINSDVYLTLRPEELPELGDRFIFGHRIDVPHFGRLSGEPFIAGFDFFFFHGRFRRAVPASLFQLGRPAWDYWLPWCLAKVCRPLLLTTPAAFHAKHEQRWDKVQHHRFCDELRKRTGLSASDMWKKLTAFPARSLEELGDPV